MGSDLGFGAAKKSLDLTDFKKKPVSSEKNDQQRFLDDEKADKIAEKKGFSSREATKRVVKKRKSKAIMDTAYVRAKIEVLNEFKEFCNDLDMTYGEGIEELLERTKKS